MTVADALRLVDELDVGDVNWELQNSDGPGTGRIRASRESDGWLICPMGMHLQRCVGPTEPCIPSRHMTAETLDVELATASTVITAADGCIERDNYSPEVRVALMQRCGLTEPAEDPR